MKLIKEFNGTLMPTNALAIVFGKLDNVMIKCARFKGTTMESFIDKKEFTGSLFEMLDDAIKFLQNHLNLNAKIEGLRRVEEYEIPLVALREIVLNAIVHRDYTRNSDIKIAIFDDIVEIISVGGFVNGLTIDEISNGRSELRNKVVANLFKELQFIESWGSGVEKVQNSCNDKGIKFELAEKGLFVEAVFYRPIKGKNADKISETTEYDRIRPNTTEYDQLILEYLQANQKITRKEAKSFLELGETKIKELFNKLIDRGLIQRVGAGRSIYYTLQSTEVS
jgi:ATP-dependent DNA helicase RecG